MNVAYFSNQFADRHGHGLARYARELYWALRASPGDHHIQPVAAWSSMEAKRLHRWRSTTGLELLPWGRRMTPATWAFFGFPRLEHWLPDADLVHAVALGYPIATGKPLVVTVHDLGPLTHPEFFRNTRPWIMRRSLRQAVRQADAIICVSHSTAQELCDYAGEEVVDRIHVVHEGVSDHFFQTPDVSCLSTLSDLPPQGVPFVLATGKISPRKNVHGLIRAMGQLLDRIPHHLVLTGGDGWDMDLVRRELAKQEFATRVHFPGYVTDNQLRALYAAASVYVHPSLYEGFGLTVLEAMAAGCPVITSNVYSLPEVAGDAAVLIDPGDVEALASAIEAVVRDEGFSKELRARGRQRAASFTWEKCAQEVLAIFRGVS